MNIIKFLEEFTTENLANTKSSRRESFGTFGSLGKKAALAAIPFGLASLNNKAKAKPLFQENSATEALQLALTLEYLEESFYLQALESGVLANDPKAEAIYMQIAQHESAHVEFLKAGLGENSIESPQFDFTVGGAFDPFNTNGDQATSYAQLLALAQAFEDTGVRAYKGQAGALMGNDALLTAALQIHSVEARHASEIRRLRGLKGWITRDQRGAGMPEATQAVYNGEQNVMQGGVDVSALGDGSPFTIDASTEAYDEILTGDEASTIASLFIVS